MLRGALAGAVAAGIWEAQSPLDRRVFGVDYSDSLMLGSAVARGRAQWPVGVAMHLLNGAVFGAVYARVAPSLPGPAVARGVAAGLGEHAATWPLLRFSNLHPQSYRIPQLWGSGRALAQATWRHALFGAVLGAIEGRLSPPEGEAAREEEMPVSSNGHGDVENLAVVGLA